MGVAAGLTAVLVAVPAAGAPAPPHAATTASGSSVATAPLASLPGTVAHHAGRATRTTLAVSPGTALAYSRVTVFATVAALRGRHPTHRSGRVVLTDRHHRVAVMPLAGHGHRPARVRFSSRSLGAGVHVLRASFRPTHTRPPGGRMARHRVVRWRGSTSPAVVIRLAPRPGCAARRHGTRNTCLDKAPFSVHVPAGPLLLHTSLRGPVVFRLPRAPHSGPTVSATALRGRSRITVIDLRAHQPGWGVTVAVSRVRHAGHTVPGHLVLDRARLHRFPGDTLGGPTAPVALRSAEPTLGRPALLASAAPGHSRGSVRLSSRVRLLLPATAHPGRYVTTVTVTIV